MRPISKQAISLFLLLSLAFWGCQGKKPDFASNQLTRVHTDLNYIKDESGRYVYFHGVNASASSKFPANEDQQVFTTSGPPSYVGKPFPLADADRHFQQLHNLGINSIRLIMTWEAVQPEAPGKFDQEYLDYIQKIVEKANEHHIYVLMDMHQDLFSRFMISRFNDMFDILKTGIIKHGSMEAMVAALVPPYNNAVRGDGAPKWAVQAIMPEKNLDSGHWGSPRIFGRLDANSLNVINSLAGKFLGSGFSLPPDILNIVQPDGPFDITETSDFLPLTMWGINGGISLDMQRCFAAFFAGRDVYPTLLVDEQGHRSATGRNIQDFLQDNYTTAWVEVAKKVKDYPNVIGYDIINEPVGFFLVLTLAAASFELGGIDEIVNMLSVMSAQAPNSDMIRMVQELFDLLVALQIIPPDSSTATKEKWGFQDASLMGLLGLNIGFDKNHMQPFFEKTGGAIQAVDPKAVIWIEPSIGLDTALGGALGIAWYESNMTRPAGLNHVVYEPHWYPDIYPTIGFNTGPRSFTPEEWRFRDFRPSLQGVIRKAAHSLGNMPVVLGEYGTEYNFNGWNPDGTLKAMAKNPTDPKVDYPVSQEILDNYYEAFEDMLLSHMQWCWSPESTYARGEGWNNEDFSIVDLNLKPRGEEVYSRPHPTFLSGKPVSMRFYSRLHYFDRDKGEVNKLGEYELAFKSKETNAPTEIFIPYDLYYANGFYVWLTDGYAVYDHADTTLFYYPTSDEPGHIHKIRIRPPLDGQENLGWQYFFKEDQVLSHGNPGDFE